LLIFDRGESGSGKSEIRKLTIRHLVRLSSHRKESKVQTQIIESQRVFEAFGQCQTHTNMSGSRFGYYGEIQFNERGRMVGAKNLHYFLEKSRVTGHSSPASADGNFNVFYYLLAGVSPDEKAALQITTTEYAQYSYLNKYKKRTPQTAEDASKFEQLKASLKMCGFRKEHIGRIIQLIATILHLGNLVFVDPVGTGTQEAAFVKNTELLDIVADFLGLDPHALENVLTFKTTMIRKDFTTLILNAEQAALQRDNLCQTLYSLLFSWVVERINSKTCVDDFNSFIGILDFPGLQTSLSVVAGFDQLCVNLGNERIQHYINQTMFQTETDVFRSEGIHIPEIAVDESCVDLLSRPKGVCDLVNTMTDVSKRTYTDDNIMDSLVKFNTTHPAFSIKNSDTNARRFVINHYDGSNPVQYSTDGFIAENNSQISVDFVSLFKGGLDVRPSWNSFIVDLFVNIKVENHPKNNSAIVAARQSAKPMRAPSQRRSMRKKGGNIEKKEGGAAAVGSASTPVLQQIQSAMDDLVQSFEEVKLWSVFCILPKQQNGSSSFTNKNSFDNKYVEAQLEQMKITSILQLPTIQYIESYPHQEFLDRYGHLFKDLDHSRLLRSQCETAAGIMNWTANNMCTTQNKVFYHIRFLYHMLFSFINRMYIGVLECYRVARTRRSTAFL
jgi:chitin synthase